MSKAERKRAKKQAINEALRVKCAEIFRNAVDARNSDLRDDTLEDVRYGLYARVKESLENGPAEGASGLFLTQNSVSARRDADAVDLVEYVSGALEDDDEVFTNWHCRAVSDDCAPSDCNVRKREIDEMKRIVTRIDHQYQRSLIRHCSAKLDAVFCAFNELKKCVEKWDGANVDVDEILSQ